MPLHAEILMPLAEGGTRVLSTIGELRDFLLTIGLDITTSDAQSWGLNNPIEADHITQICQLEQQLADLKARSK